jgi:hypothetical protein
MALIFHDSFPYGDFSDGVTRRWNVVSTNSGSITIQSSNGRFGGRWMQMNAANAWGYNQYIRKTIGGTRPTIFFQCGYKPVLYNGPGYIPILSFLDSGTCQIALYDYVGILKAYRGQGTDLLATAEIPISTNVWHQLEVKITIDNTYGEVLVKIDGVTLINILGTVEVPVDTQATANSYIDGFQLNCYGPNALMGISDIIVMDTTGSYCNDLLGARMVGQEPPIGAGTYSQFTPSDSISNYEAVDEIPPNDDTDYNTGDVDNIDTFTFAPISNPTAKIDAVICSIYAKTNDGGSASVQGIAKSFGGDSDGDEGLGTEIVVPSSYDWLSSIIYVDPHTTTPYDAAGLNDSELGYKRSA